MSYRYDKPTGDIIFDGFEKGIADSPESGIADIRSANITSVPGEVSVSFATTAGKTPPASQSGISFSAASSNSTVTVASTTNYYNGLGLYVASTSATAQINHLVVAGGGGGGTSNQPLIGAGGGGAGGLVSTSSVAITAGAYAVVVGPGGSGSANANATGVDGTDSSFNGVTAKGGGGGQSAGAGTPDIGGSGGGAASSATGANGTVGQGNKGGNGSPSGSGKNGGGGGGAGAVGGNATNDAGVAGDGGAGTASSISGASVTYAGGGGGSTSSTTTSSAGAGGAGGGGAGGKSGVAGGVGTNATANTGGGGGAGANNSGSPSQAGNGATGVVIISYVTGVLTATGGSITTSGGNTIHTFNANGTFTVTAINLQVNDVYYIGNLTSTTFKLYYDPTLSNAVTIIADLTGTYSIPTVATPVASTTYGLNAAVTSAKDNLEFMVDNTGNSWLIPVNTEGYTGGLVTAGALQWCGDVNKSTTGTAADFGIAVWNGYLLVFINTKIDYISLANLFGTATVSSKWVVGWSVTALSQTSYQHQALVVNPTLLVVCNGNYVGYLVVQSGQTFDPTNSATYTWSPQAILLGATDAAVSLGVIKSTNTLLIGATGSDLYTADLTNFAGGISSILSCPDNYVTRIVATNSEAYIFIGQRGRILITNGATVDLFKKIPDSLSGSPEPYYTWQDALYFRNKLYFTLTATDNAGSTLSTMGGIWALGLSAGQTTLQLSTAGSLFNSNQLSYGTYGGSCPCLFKIPFTLFIGTNPPGYGIGALWVNSSTVGIDIPSSSPYTGTQTYIDTDIVPVGTFYQPKTNAQVEYKLSKPLVSGESVAISWRGNLTSSFTTIPINSPIGQVSGSSLNGVNFQKQQWVQLRTTLTSTATTPSYNRLTEIRLR